MSIKNLKSVLVPLENHIIVKLLIFTQLFFLRRFLELYSKFNHFFEIFRFYQACWVATFRIYFFFQRSSSCSERFIIIKHIVEIQSCRLQCQSWNWKILTIIFIGEKKNRLDGNVINGDSTVQGMCIRKKFYKFMKHNNRLDLNAEPLFWILYQRQQCLITTPY